MHPLFWDFFLLGRGGRGGYSNEFQCISVGGKTDVGRTHSIFTAEITNEVTQGTYNAPKQERRTLEFAQMTME